MCRVCRCVGVYVCGGCGCDVSIIPLVQLCSGIAGHAPLAYPPTSKQYSTSSLYSTEGVTIATADTVVGEASFPLASATTRIDLGSEKKPPVIDHFSEKAVKISTDLDQIFDSEGEDDVEVCGETRTQLTCDASCLHP